MKMRIAADHAGFEIKEWIKKEFPAIEWVDHGTSNTESTHYPKYAQKLCEDILDNSKPEDLKKPLGILICGSGVGMSMQANRYLGIRAALCWNEEIAKLSRQHNASNVLCLSARHVDKAVNQQIVKTWMATEFEGGRHTHRIDMMDMDESCECC
jgi:ribose 5-phosphate isomerase B